MGVISTEWVRGIVQAYENILPWAIRSIIAFMFPMDKYKISLSLAAGKYNSAKMVPWQMFKAGPNGIFRALILVLVLIPYISIGFMVTIIERTFHAETERTYSNISTSRLPLLDTYQTLTYNPIKVEELCEESKDIIKNLQVAGTSGTLNCNKIGKEKAHTSSLNEIGLYDSIFGGVKRFRNQTTNDTPVAGITAFFVPINTFMINGIFSGSDMPGIQFGGSGDDHDISTYYTSFHGLGGLNNNGTWYLKFDINSTNINRRGFDKQIFNEEPYKKFKDCRYMTDVCEHTEGGTTTFLTVKNSSSPMNMRVMITIADIKIWRWRFHNEYLRYLLPFRVYADSGALNSSYYQTNHYQKNYTDPDLTGIMQSLQSSLDSQRKTITYYNETISKGYKSYKVIPIIVGLTVVYLAGLFCNFSGFTAAQSHIMDTIYASVFERKEDCMNNFQSYIHRAFFPDKYLRATYRYVGLRRTEQDSWDHGTVSVDGEYITKVARVIGRSEEIDVHGGRDTRKYVADWELEELMQYESVAENDLQEVRKASKNLRENQNITRRKTAKLTRRNSG